MRSKSPGRVRKLLYLYLALLFQQKALGRLIAEVQMLAVHGPFAESDDFPKSRSSRSPGTTALMTHESLTLDLRALIVCGLTEERHALYFRLPDS